MQRKTTPVKTLLTLFVTVLATCMAAAQEKIEIPEADDLLQSVEQWMRENLDDSVLRVLEQVDQDRVREFFSASQRLLEGKSVYDLGELKDSASRLLPLLQQFEETRPYAVWLQTHFDYFEAADELRREIKPVPPKPGKPAPLPNPTPQLQRSVWNKKMDKRPLPPLASAYVPRLKQIFAAEKMPQELVWIAEVESSFDPSARSPAGAAGLFQLMPATARSLHLAARPRDERLQPEKNARAAAKYLRSLYSRFGDWRLALAAYNAGETRVDNLLKQQNTRTFDAIARRLPAETQMYVPKVEATLRRREGRSLADLKPPTA